MARREAKEELVQNLLGLMHLQKLQFFQVVRKTPSLQKEGFSQIMIIVA